MIKYKKNEVTVTGRSRDSDIVAVRIFGTSLTCYVPLSDLTPDSADELQSAMSRVPELEVYAVIDGDGWCGDYATVYETFYDRSQAYGYMANNQPARLIHGGGLEVGQKIHRNSIGTIYPVITLR